ncbi:glutathione S-transferase family protein [Parvibaculaceae bacterium PLY_AMNH_Bact1]|nr:glutathione S-transferase family protein [Parvibaculaceae bacterium PLY_AMNH_Bact1]
MSDFVLYGPAYSAYTRIVRLVLEEKGTPYLLEEVDFISAGMPVAQKERHPFGMVPALEHEGHMLFEAGPICSYLDEVLPAPPLAPSDPVARAQMAATISVLDNYIWPDLRELVTQTLFTTLVGGWPDDLIKERMVKRLAASLAILEERFVAVGALNSKAVTLADLHAVPMIAYLAETLDGQLLLQDLPALSGWWNEMKNRPSVVATAFDLAAYPWAQKTED